MGSRFLLLEHRGRRSGKRRRTVIEVVDRDRSTGTYWIAAAWGDRADWYKNVKVDPRVRVTVGRRRFDAIAEVLPAEDSPAVLDRYAREHRTAARALARILGYDSVDQLKERVPVVELRPPPE